MTEQLRWGVLGAAWIAELCVPCIQATQGSSVVAVASRDAERARSFAARHSIEATYGSYDELLAAADVDAVYIPVPNALHYEWARAALSAGKHVLCEKPLTTSVADAEALFDQAAASGLVLAEAFMYRHHPQIAALLDAIEAGAVGTVSAIYSTFFTLAADPAHNIRYDPALGGGALWDVGSYCVSLATLIAGVPTHAAGVATVGPSGVDVGYAGVLGFAGGQVAQFACGIESALRTEVIVTGSERTLTMSNPWIPDVPADIWNGPAPPAGFELHRGVEIERTVVAGANPYGLQARDFAAAVRGAAEIVPSRAETVRTIATIEQLEAHTTRIAPAVDVNVG